MILLIDKEKVASKLQVAIGYDDIEFNTFINEAQEFDFKPMVKEDFYYDLLSKRADLLYQKLITGGDYVFNDRDYHFQGIEAVLSYFAYGRFVMNSSAVSTSHGMVIKTTPNSTPLSIDERRNFWYKKKEEASLLMQDVVKYIERNITNYPSWNSSLACQKINNFKGITRVIK